MEVTRIRALRGPNLWSHNTAIQSIVSCSPQERAIEKIDGFEARLRARFPEISPFQPQGHEESVPMVHVLELAALGLQAQAGCPVTFSCSTPTVDADVYQLVVEYSEEAVGRLAMDLAEALCKSAQEDTPSRCPHATTRSGRRCAFGAQHGLYCRRGSGPQYPLQPHDRGQHGSVWLGQQTTAYSSGRN